MNSVAYYSTDGFFFSPPTPFLKVRFVRFESRDRYYGGVPTAGFHGTKTQIIELIDIQAFRRTTIIVFETKTCSFLSKRNPIIIVYVQRFFEIISPTSFGIIVIAGNAMSSGSIFTAKN